MLGAATACVALALGVWGVRTPEVAALGPPQQPAAFLGAPAAAAAAWPLQHSLRCSRQQQQQQQQLAAARKPFVGGNWKCNGDTKGAEAILQMLNDAPPEVDDIEARVVVAPPALHAGLLLRGLRRPFAVALQDSSEVKGYGAFTGEIAPQMAKDFGIKTVIVGHSERRAGFGKQPGESNEVVAAKAKNAVDHGLQVIACIGESLETRQSGKTMEFLGQQLQAYASALAGVGWRSVVIAYEPIWAIGTGQTASPQTAQQTHKEIREWLRQHVGEEVAQQTRIIYGGSVKGSNAMASYSTHSAS
ncbi:triosephosphate isomerase, putative [Eimeria tenella]|uniref:Triosephosphate isomerase n=1 Tax=Eimeria tenella TaxID=5802 RepID=U6KFY1_EIMTE|nr:triosephosphate isomerase, putative [Eimeria tenella]CDJ36940.1 triosephosphate isomerase, putative [Eimeria tenella]|eukprot:XP_013227778.1 triosephosphate isomerase, putative [Eimeria tenella]